MAQTRTALTDAAREELVTTRQILALATLAFMELTAVNVSRHACSTLCLLLLLYFLCGSHQRVLCCMLLLLARAGGCPSGPAWFDFATAVDTLHADAECSNQVGPCSLSPLSLCFPPSFCHNVVL